MTLLTSEQYATANKAQIDVLFGLTNKAIEGMEKLLQLNLQVVKSTLDESREDTQRMVSVKDVQKLTAWRSGVAQPSAEKALSYCRHLYEIASAMQAEFSRVAELQFEDQNRKMQTLVDNVVENAPADSETAIAVLKSAITAANIACETVHRATKHAVDIAESNFNAVASSASKTASQSTARTSRTRKKSD